MGLNVVSVGVCEYFVFFIKLFRSSDVLFPFTIQQVYLDHTNDDTASPKCI